MGHSSFLLRLLRPREDSPVPVDEGRFRNTRHTVTFGMPLQNFFLKHPALPVEVALNRNYLKQNSVCLATL
jgi:hypothetical protein